MAAATARWWRRLVWNVIRMTHVHHPVHRAQRMAHVRPWVKRSVPQFSYRFLVVSASSTEVSVHAILRHILPAFFLGGYLLDCLLGIPGDTPVGHLHDNLVNRVYVGIAAQFGVDDIHLLEVVPVVLVYIPALD